MGTLDDARARGHMTDPTSLWHGRRVLVTGHTGFKGAWLLLWLGRLGAQVTGLALAPEDPGGAFGSLSPWSHRHVTLDVRDGEAVVAAIGDARPEVVFHLAAQALVRRGYADPVGTYATNVTGTANVLKGAATARASAVVVVTSDKVYAVDPTGRPFVETDRLGGADPYSASKACAELVVGSWRAVAPELAVATARAGNVIGGGDTAPDRLLPDIERALSAGRPVGIRHPDSVRPWQFVLEPLYGYLLLAATLLLAPSEAPEALNFGPDGVSWPVSQVVDRALELYGGGSWQRDEASGPPETHTLRLDATEATARLGWRPRLDLDTALAWTVEWWTCRARGGNLRALAEDQLDRYEALVAA